jgi:hypothetical protein
VGLFHVDGTESFDGAVFIHTGGLDFLSIRPGSPICRPKGKKSVATASGIFTAIGTFFVSTIECEITSGFDP